MASSGRSNLAAKIVGFIDDHNRTAKPLRWTALAVHFEQMKVINVIYAPEH